MLQEKLFNITFIDIRKKINFMNIINKPLILYILEATSYKVVYKTQNNFKVNLYNNNCSYNKQQLLIILKQQVDKHTVAHRLSKI